MPKLTKKYIEVKKLQKTFYYKFVYFICEKLIIWQFLFFILFFFRDSLLLQKTVISLIITFTASEGIKGVYTKQRPKHPLLGNKIDSSFPSSHAALSFCLFYSATFFDARLFYSIVLFVMAIFISVGRVLGGAHFKIDVIGGAFLAFICTFIVYLLNLSINLSI